jgi:pyruvate kinase
MKAICTLGPASSNPDLIFKLSKISDRFRLNVAHSNAQSLNRWLTQLTDTFHQLGTELPVVLDLQGSKMRIGSYPNCQQIPETIYLFLGDKSDTLQRLPVPHPDLFRVLAIGDILSLNDAKIKLEVTEILDNQTARGKVIQNGALDSCKGINRTHHPVPFTQVSQRDKAAIAVGLQYPFVQFACSFVFDGTEVPPLRQLIGDRHLIAKLERPESLVHLSTIDRVFDELWLCRGDLGAQAGLTALGQLQAQFVRAFPELSSPKYLAGQVLEYMTHFPKPTRSEVVHLYDIQQAGFDGIVLSDETAIGQHPEKVAEFLSAFFNAEVLTLQEGELS